MFRQAQHDMFNIIEVMNLSLSRMLKQFLNHIRTTSHILSGQRILLAVSGGIDSMVMLDLFTKSKLQIAVAHCNFQLRGEASAADEVFVKAYCEQCQITFYTKTFSVQAHADQAGISIQMAARELRYAWFMELLEEQGFDWLATAHHLNDNLETVLLNLARGTGLDGLTGIPQRNGKIIRPLLTFTKEAIEAYARDQAIEWREDASNQTDAYDRNFVRQQIVPLLKKLNPSLEDGFQTTQERLTGTKMIVTEQIDNLQKQIVEKHQDAIKISVDGILATGYPAVALWYLVREYGFTFDQCKRIVEPHETGTSFYANSIRLTIDRGQFIITKAVTTNHAGVLIDSGQLSARLGLWELTITKKDNREPIDKNPDVALFDVSTLKYPLTWRSWEPGDQFIPLGMQHHKKVSDFLIDEKVSLPDKEKVTVLESGGEICWVVGHRISDRFKIKPSTEQVIIIRKIQ